MTGMTRAQDRRTVVARVAGRMLGSLPDLVDRMGAAYQAEVPEYAALSAEELRAEVLPVSSAVVETFFRAVADGRPPDAFEVPGLEEMGARRLEMGITLEPMLHVYRIAGRAVFESVVDAIEPGEEAALAEIGARWMDYIDQSSSRAATGYMAASDERVRRDEARRGAVLQALVGARDAAEVAAVASEFSLSLASAYAPVVAPASEGHLDEVVAAAPPGSFAGYRGSVLLVLVPEDVPDVAGLHRVVGEAPMAWGRPSPPGPALRQTVDRAERALAAAVSRGLATVVGPEDLLLEQVAVADEALATTLERVVVVPLRAKDPSGALESTLRVYLGCGSVPETARLEIVHANTVGYRLRRVAVLTGFDPRVPAEAAVLVLALVAADRGTLWDPQRQR